MTNFMLATPVILPLLTAAIGLFLGKKFMVKRILFLASGVLQFLFALGLLKLTTNVPLVFLPLGGWETPFGIALAVDLLSAILVTLTTLISLVTIIYTLYETDEKSANPFRLVLMQTIITGINLSFMTGDFFNLFVAFELMLLSSYALMTLETKSDRYKYAFPYITINLVASTLFLCAGGLFYSLFGNLSFAGISTVSNILITDPRLVIMGVFLVFVFGLKAGLFPLYYWLPNSYPTLPPAIGAIFGGLLTKVGAYTLIRIFGTILPQNLDFVYNLIAILAVPTMVFGIFAALTRKTIRGVISCNIVSHVGFILLGIGLFTIESISAVIFYMIHHILVIAVLFLITGLVIEKLGTDEFAKTGGLWDHKPLIGILFLIQAFSLSGLPPFSGFWGKLLVFQAVIAEQKWVFIIAAALSSILTLVSMIKIWIEVFWKENPKAKLHPFDGAHHGMTGAVAILFCVTIGIGLFPNTFINLANQAGLQALDQQSYRKTIFKFENIKSIDKHESTSSHSDKKSGGHH